MRYRSLFRLSIVVAVFALIVSSLAASAQQGPAKRGRKFKMPPPTGRIEVTVVRDTSGKPIVNASVIFHPMEGEKDKGNMELKTNEDGKTVIDVLLIGDTVRLQVIAKGFQTYGEDYKIDKAEMAIEIKMKPPGEQYSIYKPHGTGEVGGKSTDGDKTANPAKEAAPAKDAAPAPAPAKDKPAGSATQPDTQPSPAQAQPQPK
jgi:5-hydroxyisourate hydrolase-like protein (transthyretin family)